MLRVNGLDVYDFRAPAPGDHGFRWTDVDPSWRGLNGSDGITRADSFRRVLHHPVAAAGYAKDFAAMERADAFVLVLPCGRSAHLELGWAAGQYKRTAVLLDDPCTPELMYRMVDVVTTSLDEIADWLLDPDIPRCRVCGCTEAAACPGGCWWVPDPYLMGDLCSACRPIVLGGAP